MIVIFFLQNYLFTNSDNNQTNVNFYYNNKSQENKDNSIKKRKLDKGNPYVSYFEENKDLKVGIENFNNAWDNVFELNNEIDENNTYENHLFWQDSKFDPFTQLQNPENNRSVTNNTEFGIPKLLNKDFLSCYVNTVLQGLYHCRSFRDYIEKHTDDHKVQNMTFCLKEIFEKMDSSKEIGFDAKSILLELQCFDKIDKNKQEDAQEFLSIIFNEIKNEYNYKNIGTCDLPFLFQFQTPKECEKCGKLESITCWNEDFFVSIYENQGTINEQIRMKILSNSEKGNFSNVESCEHAFEKTNNCPIYNNSPQVLCLHVLRYTWNNSKAQKSDFPIDIPIFLNFVNKSYKLRSVCLHTGYCDFGHYSSLIYKDDELYLCSDSIINKKENKDILKRNENAYLIFYELNEDYAI